MAPQLQFFDMSVTTTPPSGWLEPLPITLGPNWRPGDVRVVLISAAGSQGSQVLDMAMQPDPPTGFTAAYQINPTHETHGVYYRRLQVGDQDSSTMWVKPPGWSWFMFALLTVRGVNPTTNPTAGSLSRPGSINYLTDNATTSFTVAPVTVPGNGVMVFFLGNIAAPEGSPWPQWAVAMGIPTGWTHLVATDKSGLTYYPYDTNPSVIVAGKSFTSAGTTGTVTIPAGKGTPAFSGLYAFFTPASDVSVSLGAA